MKNRQQSIFSGHDISDVYRSPELVLEATKSLGLNTNQIAARYAKGEKTLYRHLSMPHLLKPEKLMEACSHIAGDRVFRLLDLILLTESLAKYFHVSGKTDPDSESVRDGFALFLRDYDSGADIGLAELAVGVKLYENTNLIEQWLKEKKNP